MITIYGKEGCSKCKEALEYFDDKNYEYEYHDLSKKEKREQRKIYRKRNWTMLPVIVIDDKYTLQGFGEKIVGELLCATNQKKMKKK